MTVGIVGLGLIGGSMARAYKDAGHTVYAADIDVPILEMSQLAGVTDGVLDETTIGRCELILIAIPPQECVEWLRDNAAFVGKGQLVLDLSGVKREVCRPCFALAEENGFIFAGGHPMAGTQYAGFKHSRANMFKGAPMVVVPPAGADMDLLERIRDALAPAQFGRFSVTTAEAHDKLIAFTSQMAHVVSNAYIKSPTARAHKGFSAGSYKDLTRVAWLNPGMWAELFMENRDNLLKEIDWFMQSMEEYRQALLAGDEEELVRLLEEGRQRKAQIDGR
jgi:prephenate dehydrogenase